METKSTADKNDIQMMAGLTFRPECDTDLGFLQRLYASTRSGEMDLVDWSIEEKNQFLQSQFQAQHSYYLTHFPDGRFDVIERERVAIGRLYVAHWPHEIRLIDIAILPEDRGRGLGGRILQALLQQAAATGKFVSLSVEREGNVLEVEQSARTDCVTQPQQRHLLPEVRQVMKRKPRDDDVDRIA